jgi:hypothetical protein
VPVGFAIGVAVALFAGEGRHGNVLGWVVPAVLSLTAPTAAVLLALRAVRDREPAGRTAAVVTVVLLVLTLVALPLLVVSWLGGVLAALVVVVVLSVTARRPRESRSHVP